MQAKHPLTRQQKMFGALLAYRGPFMQRFWSDEFTLPRSTRQKLFQNDYSDRVLLATARKTGKTIYDEVRIIQGGLTHYGESASERMMVTPGEKQLDPIWDRVIARVNRNLLFRAMKLSANKNEGVLKFRTGVSWFFRIDGSSGSDINMVGLRLEEIIGDEMAFTVRATHSSRKQSALPGCKWVYSGVPNGVRHTPFWSLDQTRDGAKWSRHKFSTFVNPLYWALEARARLIEDYGRGTQDFLTQVMGVWGEELFSSFPPGSMLIDPTLPYKVLRIQGKDIPMELDEVSFTRLAAHLVLPKPKKVYQFVIGEDYGNLQDPSVYGVAYRESKESHDWKMLCRVQVSVAYPQAQARLLSCLTWILGEKLVARICLDQSNAGLAVATELLEQPDRLYWAARLLDFAAGGTITVKKKELDEETEVGVGWARQEETKFHPRRTTAANEKKVRRKQYFTEKLQAALLAARADLPAEVRLTLAPDDELEQELIDTRERKTEAGNIVYLSRSEGKHRPVDHVVDMLRSLICAAIAAQDDEMIEEGDEDDLAQWSDQNLFSGDHAWQAPWARPQLPSLPPRGW